MGLRFFFLPNFPGALFIQGAKFISDSRVHILARFWIESEKVSGLVLTLKIIYVIQYFLYVVWLLKYLKISFRKYQENWIKTTSNPDLDWVFRYLFESLDYISYRIFKMVAPKSCWEKTGKYLWQLPTIMENVLNRIQSKWSNFMGLISNFIGLISKLESMCCNFP